MAEIKALRQPPPQKQNRQPGIESSMFPKPEVIHSHYKGSEKLINKVALITGGDSGIGRSIAVHYAREKADVVIVYLNEHQDAEETKRMVEQEGGRCLCIPGDVGQESFCQEVIQKAIREFGKLDILINNAAEQHPTDKLENISADQLEKTFRTNIFSYFFMTKAALPYLKEGACIINTTSVTAYVGSSHLLDYSSTKGAIVAFTRSLSESLIQKGIRVNGVAPGPIWTPLIPSTFTPQEVEQFGQKYPMKRPGQPSEVAPSYVFLASEDSSFMSGQILHPNGGEIVNS